MYHCKNIMFWMMLISFVHFLQYTFRDTTVNDITYKIKIINKTIFFLKCLLFFIIIFILNIILSLVLFFLMHCFKVYYAEAGSAVVVVGFVCHASIVTSISSIVSLYSSPTEIPFSKELIVLFSFTLYFAGKFIVNIYV